MVNIIGVEVVKIKKWKNEIKYSMSKPVITVKPDVTVYDASKVMDKDNIGAVVVAQNGKVLGIFTERDVIRRVVSKNMDTKNTLISKVMTKKIVSATPEDTIFKATSIMNKKNIKRLPIITKDGKLAGIMTSTDVVEVFAKSIVTGNLCPDSAKKN